MGKPKTERSSNRSKTLPSSPTHSFSSSSSSDFEFRISISPRKSSASLCPADELFYKGQLLPLQLSPRISMVRNLLASSSTSSSTTATTSASRDSSSSTDSTSSSFAADLSLFAAGDPCCDSSRPSSVTDDDHLLHPTAKRETSNKHQSASSKYFSSFSRIFKKDPPKHQNHNNNNNNKKMSVTAKEVIRKYLKKVKPLYEKLSQKQAERQRIVINGGGGGGAAVMPARTGSGVERSDREVIRRESSLGSNINNINNGTFSGNLKYCPRMMRRSYVASCPSSMRSSPSHSGVLNRAGLPVRTGGGGGPGSSSSSSSSSETSTMEELQNAIQGAITHCKNSMLQQNSSSFSHTASTCVIIGKGKAKEI